MKGASTLAFYTRATRMQICARLGSLVYEILAEFCFGD
jgi:hypothetical protein